MSQKLVTEFQNGQHSGLIAVILCGMLSLLAVGFVWVRLIWVAVARGKKGITSRFMPELVFFQTQLGAYIASLLMSNLLSCIGYAVNVTWLMQGGVTTGILCTTQGVLTQIGDTATAYFTAAIAVHTFCTLALRNRLPVWCCWVAVVFGWLLTIAAGLVPSFLNLSSGAVYATDGATCGVSLQYPLVQMLLHLVPVLIAALIAAVFYSLVFLSIRGTLTIKGGVKFTLDPQARWDAQNGHMEYFKFIAAIAKSMLIYPIAYVVLMMPHIVLCLVETSGFVTPFSAKVFASAAAGLLGVFNVMILYNTLRIMGPAFGSAPSVQQKSDVESFASPEDKSPVDVAPSVSAILAQRAFPPPRMSTTSLAARQTSTASLGGESTHHLLPGHAHTFSDASTVTVESLQRSITPVGELNEMLVSDAPITPHIMVDSASSGSDSDDSSLHSLPAPRRQVQKPHLRRPTVPSAIQVPDYHMERGMLSAVNLQTPAAVTAQKARNARECDTFVNMYTSRSATGIDVTVVSPSPPRRSIRPSASARNFADRIYISSFTSPRAAPTPPRPFSSSSSEESSPEDFSGGRVLAELPLSPFAEGLMNRARKAQSPEHIRTQSEVASPAFGNMSSLAKDALLRNATKNGKAARRRSKSLDATPRRGVPDSLRPDTPLSSRAMQFVPSPRSPAAFALPSPRTPLPPTPSSRPRSPLPGLPATPVAYTSARSPPQSARRLPKTPASASFL